MILEQYDFAQNDNRYARLAHTVRQLQTIVAERQSNLEDLEKSLPFYRDQVDFFDIHSPESLLEILQQNISETIPEGVGDRLKTIRFFSEQKLGELIRNVENLKEDVVYYTKQLAQKQLKLDAIAQDQKSKVVKVSDINERLKNTPVSNFAFETHRNGDIKIRFIVRGIKAKINFTDNQRYPFINAGDDIYINIPNVKVSVYSSNGSVYLNKQRTSKNNPVSGYTFYNDGQRDVHPHVLNGNKACLGDFESPVRDCIHDGDMVGLATVITMFLSQVAESDPAGATWKGYLRYYHGDYRNYIQREDCEIQAKEFTRVTVKIGDTIHNNVRCYEGLRVTDEGVVTEKLYHDIHLIGHVGQNVPDTIAEPILERWGVAPLGLLTESEVEQIPGIEIIQPMTDEQIAEQRKIERQAQLMTLWQESQDIVLSDAWNMHRKFLEARERWASMEIIHDPSQLSPPRAEDDREPQCEDSEQEDGDDEYADDEDIWLPQHAF